MSMEEVTKEGPGEPPQTNRVSVDPPPAMSKEEVTEEGSGELPRMNRDTVDPPPAISKEEVTEEGSEEPSQTKRDSVDPPPAPLFDSQELRTWLFYRAVIAEFVAALLYLYFTIATIIGYMVLRNLPPYTDQCNGVGLLGVAWSFGGMIFVLVYCTAGISGGHINPAVTFGFFLVRRVSLPRAIAYIAAQCSGAICGAGLARAFMTHLYDSLGGGVNSVSDSYSKRTALGAEIIGTFVLMYTVFSASNTKRSARVSHIPVLAPLPIGFAVFMVHLATIPITGTGINPARSLGAVVIYNHDYAWDDQWIFWFGPFVGAFAAAICHQCLSRATAKEPLRIRWLDYFLNCILEDPSEFLLDNA